MRKLLFLTTMFFVVYIQAETTVGPGIGVLKEVEEVDPNLSLSSTEQQQISRIIKSGKGDEMYVFRYIIKEEDSFASILKYFVKPDSIINANTPMIHIIRDKNPQVKSWANLPVGVEVDLYIQKEFLNEAAYQQHEKEELKKIAEKRLAEKKKHLREKKENAMPKGLKLSAFYMASGGYYEQKSNDLSVNVKTAQNSPYSIGIAALYYPENKLHSFSSSFYYSALKGTASNLGLTVDIPAELGTNFYGEYRLIGRFPVTLYGGIDLERFSTFNIDALYNDSKIIVDNSTVGYLTLGAAKVISLGKIYLFNKLSFSKSLFSSTENNYGSSEYEDFTGFKFMYYANYKISRRTFIHGLAKWHVMSGPNDMNVTRYGLGFGYILK